MGETTITLTIGRGTVIVSGDEAIARDFATFIAMRNPAPALTEIAGWAFDRGISLRPILIKAEDHPHG